MRMARRTVLVLGIGLSLGACSRSGLVDLRSATGGPDEFLVQPVKPLTPPESYNVLPTPTPGGANITDPQPLGDAVAALGGQPSALDNTGVPAADAALVSQASRYGVQGDIRTTLAQEDEEFRKRRGRLTQFRIFRVNRYNQVYNRQAIDPFAETSRYRAAGAGTPTSPPRRN